MLCTLACENDDNSGQPLKYRFFTKTMLGVSLCQPDLPLNVIALVPSSCL